MDKQYHYHEKCVHDIMVGDMTVRLWDEKGTAHRKIITQSFLPLARTGFVFPFVCLMPDYHPGEGSMIGSVIPTRDVVLPGVMGGDLGCGMTALPLPVTEDRVLPSRERLVQRLREAIPAGSDQNAVVSERVEKSPVWNRGMRSSVMTNRLRRKMMRQFGSLGGGNHFLEIQRGEEGDVWAMLHSGSRFFGVRVRDYYLEAGATQMNVDARRYSKIPFLIAGSAVADDYLFDQQVVVDFARASRREMMLRVLEVFADLFPLGSKDEWTGLIDSCLDVTHNFVAREEHFGQSFFVHRKGAIRLSKEQLGLVPGSMGTQSYVVEGRGNPFGLCSCSHGAGRAMSRSDALRQISEDEFHKSMNGIVYNDDRRLRDEAPRAYKDIHHVMRSQHELVKVRHRLDPLMSVKGV